MADLKKVISLWSGGKDSTLACYKAKQQGYNIAYLLNFVSKETQRSFSHRLNSALILSQASLTEIPLIQIKTEKSNYTQQFKQTINEFKQKDAIQGIVFGDIFLEEHKEWIDKVCSDLDIKPILPLWKQDTKALSEEFIDLGFESILISIKKDLFNETWLGKKINKEFYRDLRDLNKEIDPFGERGEFHSFVTKGPLFKGEIEITTTRITSNGNHLFLDILDWELKNQ